MSEKKKSGRPRKEINWELFESLCQLQCTQVEIASVLKVDSETLRDHARVQYNEPDFSLIYKRFSEGGKASLRRNQYNLSKKNASMAIWLGKQWLGQRDHDDKDKLAPNDGKLDSLIDGLKLERELANIKEENEQLKKLLPTCD